MCKKFLILLIILLLTEFIYAQCYYGKNNFGKVEIINDSTCLVSFLYIFSGIHTTTALTDTCYIKTIGDTILLSSKIKKHIEIKPSLKAIENDNADCQSLTIIYYYKKIKNKYKLYNEIAAIHDERIVCNYTTIWNGVIIVFLSGLEYIRVLYEGTRTDHFTIEISGFYETQFVYFDNFKLLKKGNKLIPIDTKQNTDCFINNGFYFPIMKKSNEFKPYKCIVYWTKGLQGLPNIMLGTAGKPFYPDRYTPIEYE
jgi:hypothetical protein